MKRQRTLSPDNMSPDFIDAEAKIRNLEDKVERQRAEIKLGEVIIGDAEALISELEAEAEAQHAEIQRLQSLVDENVLLTFADLRKKSEALERQVEETTEKNEILHAEKKELHAEKKELQARKRELQNKNVILQRDLKEVKADLAEYKGQKTPLFVQARKNLQPVGALNLELHMLKKDYIASQEKIEEVTSELSQERQLRGELEDRVTELTDNLATAENELKQKDTEMEQLNDEIQEYKLSAENETKLKRKLQSDLDNALGELGDEAETSTKMLCELEQITNELREEVQERTKLQNKVRQLHNAIAAAEINAEGSMGEAQVKINELQTKLTKMTEDRENNLQGTVELQNRVDQLQREMIEAQAHAEATIRQKEYELQVQDEQIERYKLSFEEKHDVNKELQSEMEQLKKERKEETETYKMLKFVMNKVMAENEEALKVKSELENEIVQLKQEVKHAAALEEEKKGEEILAQQHAKSQEEVERLEVANKTLQSELEQVRNEMDALGTKHEMTLRTKHELESKIAQLNLELNLVSKASTSNNEKEGEVNSAVAQDDMNNQGTVEQLRAANKTLQSELEQVRKEMAGEAEANRRLKVILKRLMSTKSDLEDKMAQMSNGNADMDTSKSDATKEEVEDLRERVEKYQTSLDEREEEIEKLESELHRLKIVLKRVMGAKDEALRVQSELESKLAQAMATVAVANDDTSERKNDVDPEEIQQLYEEIEKYKDALEEQEKSNEELSSELYKLKDEMNEYDETYSELKTVLKRLMTENEEALRTNSKLERKIDRMNRELAIYEKAGQGSANKWRAQMRSNNIERRRMSDF